jgi:hypothetical protein
VGGSQVWEVSPALLVELLDEALASSNATATVLARAAIFKLQAAKRELPASQREMWTTAVTPEKTAAWRASPLVRSLMQEQDEPLGRLGTF